jgi:hypothetical protein
MTVITMSPWPLSPQAVRAMKKVAASADARRGSPVGPVHPAQGERPCDRTYANHYFLVRCGLMTAEEIAALVQAEADYDQALDDIKAAERRLAEARARIVKLVAPGSGRSHP